MTDHDASVSNATTYMGGDPALKGMPCDELAGTLVELIGDIRRWTILDRISGTLVRNKLRGLMFRQRDVVGELADRFGPLLCDVLTASGCPGSHLREKLGPCFVRLDDLLQRNHENLGFPEVMWRATVAGRSLPGRLSGRLRARFHLRALLDELPESEARDELRRCIFPTGAELSSRAASGIAFDVFYQSDRREAVILGLGHFANALYESSHQLERRTGGAIRVNDCQSVLAAYQFLCATVLND